MRKIDRGWFITEGRDGDRTLDEQMRGLEPLAAEVRGKRVLDLGCAEGLIGMALLEAGAATVTGLDSIEDHLVAGRRIAQRQGLDIVLVEANLNDCDLSTFAPVDIVLLLAILHKLHNPTAVARAAAKLSTDLVVIRLPPSGLVIRDMRSMMLPHDIGAVMQQEGFMLEATPETSRGEWLGYFRRPKKAAAPAPAPAATPPAPPPVEPSPTISPAEVVRSVEHVSTAEVPADKPQVDEAPKSDSPKESDAAADSNAADKPVEAVPPVTTESFSGNAGAAAAQDAPSRAPRAPRMPRADKAKE